MKSMKVSVVVIVYNKEDILHETLDSVLNQSLNDIEIIIVNDGSTDNSKEVIKEYTQKSPQLIYIEQENSGPSAARNTGLRHATGEYVAFLDGDDTVDPTTYEFMYREAKKAQADTFVGDIQCFNETKKWKLPYMKRLFKKGLPKVRHILKNPELNFSPSASNKLFNRSMLTNNNIQFNEELRVGEDLLFTQQALICSNKTVVNKRTVLNYRVLSNGDSLIQSSSIRFFRDLLETQKELVSFYKEKEILNKIEPIENRQWEFLVASILKKAAHLPDYDIASFLEVGHEYVESVYTKDILTALKMEPGILYHIFKNNQLTEMQTYFELLRDKKLNKTAFKMDNQYYNYFAKYYPQYKKCVQITEFKLNQKVEILSLRGDKLQIGGYAFIEELNNTGSIKELHFVNKSNGQVIKAPLETLVRSDISYVLSKNSVDYDHSGFKTTTLSLSEILPDGDYEVLLVVQLGDVVLKKPLHIFYFSTKASTKPSTTRTHSIVPYFPKKNLHIRIKKAGLFGKLQTNIQRISRDFMFEVGLLVLKREWKAFLIFYLYRLTQARLRKKHIWFIGERKDTAQDNSYHLFKYIRENNLVENCYYLIDKNAKDYERIKDLGNAIQYGSIRHTLYLLTCDKSINAYSERANMYTNEYIQVLKCHPEWQQNQKIFLQHGVIGVSRVNHVLNKNRMDYSLFIVSSQFEKDHIVSEFGYDENEVAITGLARWDQLEDVGNGKTILLMPTWRNWNKSTPLLMSSDYFNRYMSLLSNPHLHHMLEENDLTMLFYPHYETQRYMKEVPDFHPRIKIVRQGEETVQSLLKRSDLLITDYSTVSFDFSYMEKPVIFYQFDYDRFYYEHYNQGPITQDLLFGEVVTEEEQVLKGIQKFVNKDEEFMSNTKDNPYVIRTPKQHAKLNYEAIKNR
ncbi:CDP-glycerol glycerophosphotransferase family protein [Bacillus sp. RG28]|uniref:CDP-glycerol glycerophosphotransferase family protein n=1 Tax=Gottfriedia endophytica TaxID=2820819 RepID=A0A940SK39_9BACI|nr:glycosyltransferase [Gottfriedia endophytica]MBP0726091.1 CDP-glycerol glycerophosphotransferase family protein [Gottfriedia endophytica]